MSLQGKLVSQIKIKFDGDVFHEIFRHRPYHISSMTPNNIQKVDIHEGEWGTIGSVTSWNYFHDGKEEFSKKILEEIDEEKKLIKYKVIGGDISEKYNSFYFTIHVDTKDEDNLVTWILDYEKNNADVPDPHTYIDLVLNMSKDIETYHIK